MWDRCMKPGGQGGQEEDSAHLCLRPPGLLATPGRLRGKSPDPGLGLQPSRTEDMEGVRASFPPSSPALAGEASWAETGSRTGAGLAPGHQAAAVSADSPSPRMHFHFLSSPAPRGPPSPAGPSRASPSKNSPSYPRGRVEEGASSYSRGGEGTAQPSTASGLPRAVFIVLLQPFPRAGQGLWVGRWQRSFKKAASSQVLPAFTLHWPQGGPPSLGTSI